VPHPWRPSKAARLHHPPYVQGVYSLPCNRAQPRPPLRHCIPTILFRPRASRSCTYTFSPSIVSLVSLLSASTFSYVFFKSKNKQLLQLPQIVLMTLSATAIVHNFPNLYVYAVGLQVLSWIMQFASHAFAEGRAPALLDNLVGGTFLFLF